MQKKQKEWMEKAIRYDMLKQLYRGDALTAKALKAVFEDAEPVETADVEKSVACESGKETLAGKESEKKSAVKEEAKAEEKEQLPKAAPVIEVTPEEAGKIPSLSEEQAEDAKETAEKYKKHRKKIDHGKVKALAAAGWSAKEIAAELHCAEVTIYKILSNGGEKNQ